MILISSNIYINCKRTFGILAMCWLGFNLHGQNFKNDVVALRKKYEGNLSMNIQTQIISNDPNYSGETLTGSIKIKGSEMYYSQGSEEVLYSTGYMLLISNSEKSIIVDTATGDYNAAPLSMLQLDTLISAYQSITYANVGGKKQYTLKPKEGEVETCIITIGSSGLLEKAQITLKAEAGGGTAIVTYSGFVANPVYSKEEFSPWKYVKRVGNKFSPQKAYQSYSVDSAI